MAGRRVPARYDSNCRAGAVVRTLCAPRTQEAKATSGHVLSYGGQRVNAPCHPRAPLLSSLALIRGD
jgi:hypothetical protein